MWSRVKEKELGKQMSFSYSHLKMHCTDSVRQGVSRHLRDALKGPKVNRSHHPKAVCSFLLLNHLYHKGSGSQRANFISALFKTQPPQDDRQIPGYGRYRFLRNIGLAGYPAIFSAGLLILAIPAPGRLDEQAAQALLSHRSQGRSSFAFPALPPPT